MTTALQGTGIEQKACYSTAVVPTGRESGTAPQETFGNVRRCFGLSHLGRGATGFSRVEARDAARRPTVQETVTTSRNYPAPNASCAEDKEGSSRAQKSTHFHSSPMRHN